MRLSIIVPVFNEAGRIVSCLGRLRAFMAAGHEVIVVDGGSRDGTRDLAMGWAAVAENNGAPTPGGDNGGNTGTPTPGAPLCTRLLRGPRGRAAQMNLGAAHASGDVLLFLHADNILPPDAGESLIQACAGGGVEWGWFRVRLSGQSPAYRIIAGMMNLRARLSSVGTGDQALFVAAPLFRRIGGFPELPLMEDIAICKRLRGIARPRVLAATTVTSSRRWDEQGIARTVLRMWRLRLLYFFGVSPARLARSYYPAADPADASWKYPAARIALFTRAPKLGEVKTRLAARIGAESALALHLAMLRRVFETAERSGLAGVRLWVASNPGHGIFTALCEARHIRGQRGGDLGERMRLAAAAELAEAGVDSVVIIGGDCPALTASHLDEALAALAGGVDLVLGPALDGGYVLIGLRAAEAELFQGVEWGSGEVLEQTLERARALGLRWRLLAPLRDVDTVEDLPSLQELEPPLSFSA